jgi:hypothetical protein
MLVLKQLFTILKMLCSITKYSLGNNSCLFGLKLQQLQLQLLLQTMTKNFYMCDCFQQSHTHTHTHTHEFKGVRISYVS